MDFEQVGVGTLFQPESPIESIIFVAPERCKGVLLTRAHLRDCGSQRPRRWKRKFTSKSGQEKQAKLGTISNTTSNNHHDKELPDQLLAKVERHNDEAQPDSVVLNNEDGDAMAAMGLPTSFSAHVESEADINHGKGNDVTLSTCWQLLADYNSPKWIRYWESIDKTGQESDENKLYWDHFCYFWHREWTQQTVDSDVPDKYIQVVTAGAAIQSNGSTDDASSSESAPETARLRIEGALLWLKVYGHAWRSNRWSDDACMQAHWQLRAGSHRAFAFDSTMDELVTTILTGGPSADNAAITNILSSDDKYDLDTQTSSKGMSNGTDAHEGHGAPTNLTATCDVTTDTQDNSKDNGLGNDKLDVTCQPLTTKEELAARDIPLKFWLQRHRLFSKFAQGIWMDAESWYSATPEVIAQHHALRLQGDVVVDAFCGPGGNAIQLAMYCQHVIAVDLDANKLVLAKHNAEVYGVADRIEFIHGDALQVMGMLGAQQRQVDAVLLSPPWGGVHYLSSLTFPLSSIVPSVADTLTAARRLTSNCAMFLPRNTALAELHPLLPFGEQMEVELNVVNEKIKAMTVYFGELQDQWQG
eukprot:TRINITY_DN3052_c0_g1_i1.p1 TRINITY_DN3052_c0_g1~~TRINITY_DN3052_c0_g1_i1.p1  ORF type:complete len:586 (+),score=125.79 TRINITY_DN3052_c0_g1_i1:126-1883(+)